MSYISYLKQKDTVLVWERDDSGRHIKEYAAPYYFYYPDQNGKYLSIYGDKLSKIEADTSYNFYQLKQEFQGQGIKLFESDISPEIRVLSENYYNKPAPNLNVTFYDIEVQVIPSLGFPSVDNPYGFINSVALYHVWQKRMVLLAIPPDSFSERNTENIKQLMGKVTPLPTDVEIDVKLMGTEKHLLMEFLREIDDSDVISGWNSAWFDTPYVGKRLEKYGKRAFKLLSFPEGDLPSWREVETEFRKNTTLDLSGRISLDMLQLFRKYEQEGRQSYKLEAIAEELLPHLPKLEYQGSLGNLYTNDFIHFIRYNLRDTEILKGLEERLGYVDLANQMVHISTCGFDHVLGTLKLADNAIVNYCHHELDGLIVNDVTEPEIDRKIKGAFVLYPQTGLHEWIAAIDIKSLYPSAILTLNISPETMRGQFVSEFQAFEEIAKSSDVILTFVDTAGHTTELTAKQWRHTLQQKKWAVSGYGTVFDQTERGIIPTVVQGWFDKRIEYQKLSEQAAKQKDKTKEVYYDKLQYVYKIKLNSLYGAQSNLWFRFYNLNAAESITASGRAISKHQHRKVAQLLGDSYDIDFPQYCTVEDAIEKGGTKEQALHGPIFRGKYQSEAVLFGDTDSCYFKTFASNKEEAIVVANTIARKVNESFPDFVRNTFLCNEGFDNKIRTTREIVSDKGISVDKKRYMLHLVDKDGKPVDKMKVIGLDTKKTTVPKHVSKKINGFLEQFLKGREWKEIEKDIVTYKDELLESSDITLIGLPKGINKIEDYTQKYTIDETTRLPGHVRNAMLYNQCLQQYNDKISPVITSGMKIKNFYLKQPQGKFKGIAVPTDIEVMPEWFIDHYVPMIDRDAQVKRLVDNPLENIIKAIGKTTPTKQSLLFDSLFD